MFQAFQLLAFCWRLKNSFFFCSSKFKFKKSTFCLSLFSWAQLCSTIDLAILTFIKCKESPTKVKQTGKNIPVNLNLAQSWLVVVISAWVFNIFLCSIITHDANLPQILIRKVSRTTVMFFVWFKHFPLSGSAFYRESLPSRQSWFSKPVFYISFY